MMPPVKLIIVEVETIVETAVEVNGNELALIAPQEKLPFDHWIAEDAPVQLVSPPPFQ